MSAQKKQLLIEQARCKSCGLCITFCRQHALSIGTELNQQGYAYVVVDPEECTLCNNCRVVCPDVGISVVEVDEIMEQGEINV